MDEKILIRKIYFLTGKRYLDLTEDLRKMSEKGKRALLNIFNDCEYEKMNLKKRQINFKRF